MLRSATVHDPELQQVMSYVLNGWPQVVSASLQAYQQAQGELSLINGLLVYDSRIVVPADQRQHILQQLHETHQGLHKCRQNAQKAVWWPGISRDLKQLIDCCRVCREQRPAQRKEPLMPSVLPERPWQKLGADLLTFEGKEYLAVIDYYSRWLEVVRLQKTTATTVISKFCHIFSTHGIPDLIVSDNGPQFNCKEFRDFANEFDFKQQFSSPAFPQSNGEAESGVQIAKRILRQASPQVALLNYRATPHSSTGVSPAEALMGRKLRTKLPILPENLEPKPPSDNDIREADHKTKDKYKQNYDRRHGVVSLSPLEPGDAVLIKTDAERTWGKQSTVVGADQHNRTYLVNSPSGVLRRNRRHLQQLPIPCHDFIPSLSTSGPTADSQDIQDSEDVPSCHDTATDNTVPTIPGSRSRYITRAASGYRANTPMRFRDGEVK